MVTIEHQNRSVAQPARLIDSIKNESGKMKSNNININSWIIAIAAVIISFQVIASQYAEITSLRRELRIAEMTRKISDDQIQELMYIATRLNSEKDVTNTQQYVLGAIEAVKNPEKFNQVWHDGYDRGMATIQYAKETLPVKSE